MEKKKKLTRTTTVKKGAVKIRSRAAYELAMKTIDALMRKGEENLRPSEIKNLHTLAAAAEVFEDKYDHLPAAESLPDIVRIKLLQLRINQNLAARLLGVSEAKFSMIMNGKQKPDVYFIKAVHEKLSVDANLLLKAI